MLNKVRKMAAKNKGRFYSRLESDKLKEDWVKSGKSKKQFAHEQGLNYMTFIGWFSREKDDGKKRRGFVPIEITPSISTEGLFAELHFAKGHRLIMHREVSADYLSILLK